MGFSDIETSMLESLARVCRRCGCAEGHECKIEVIVARPNGERTTLIAHKCGPSAQGLCTACDERLKPELASLLDVWRQLGAMAIMYRSV